LDDLFFKLRNSYKHEKVSPVLFSHLFRLFIAASHVCWKDRPVLLHHLQLYCHIILSWRIHTIDITLEATPFSFLVSSHVNKQWLPLQHQKAGQVFAETETTSALGCDDGIGFIINIKLTTV
jgi:hypothetical protein